jgi:hypothetical protein
MSLYEGRLFAKRFLDSIDFSTSSDCSHHTPVGERTIARSKELCLPTKMKEARYGTLDTRGPR